MRVRIVVTEAVTDVAAVSVASPKCTSREALVCSSV